MTQKEFDEKLADIKKAEKEYNVKVDVTDIYDKDHLDCAWYGGTVATIKRNDGWEIIISAIGDIRLDGRVNGEEFYFVDKGNGGRLRYELNMTDEELHSLLNEENTETKDYLYCGNNNWFEFDFKSPNDAIIDLGGIDCYNVIDDNILDNLDGASIEYYLNELDLYLLTNS